MFICLSQWPRGVLDFSRRKVRTVRNNKELLLKEHDSKHDSKQKKQAKLVWLKAMRMEKLSRRPKQMGNEEPAKLVKQ